MIKRKLFQCLIILLLLIPPILSGNNRQEKLDTVLHGGLGDTTKRPVYFDADTLPKFTNGKEMGNYIPLAIAKAKLSCCPFKVYIGFVVEADSSISNVNIYVETIVCGDDFLGTEGEAIIEMEEEIRKIIENCPPLIPAQKHGKNVALKIVLPIHFECRK